MKAILIVVLSVVVLYVGGCTAISTRNDRAFAAIHPGDSRDLVVRAFGRPDVAETQGKRFIRYASNGCSAPCVERLWYENRLGFDTEAWSFEVDAEGTIIRQTRWHSP